MAPVAHTQSASAPRTAAWIGLLRAHAELKSVLEQELQARHGIALSSYELLSRLAHAEDGHLKMSELSSRTRLSLSRISRLMDQLERDGHASRRSCPSDSRAVHATIEDTGRALVTEAEKTFDAALDERFLGRLNCTEVEQLNELLDRLTAPC